MLIKKTDLIKIFSVSWLQILVYFIISLGIFVFFSYNTIINQMFNQSVLSNQTAKNAVLEQVKNLGDNKFVNILTIVLFWSAIGLVVYTIIWIAMIILTEARNEIVVETDYVNRGKLKDRVQGPIIQIIIFIGLLLLLALSIAVLYPKVWISSFNQFLLAMPNGIAGIGSLFVAFIGSMLNIYIVRTMASAIFSLE